MKRVRVFVMVLGALLLVLLGIVLFQQREQRLQNEKNVATRSAILNKNKPITDKMGAFVWLYAYSKNSARNTEYIKSQLETAKKTDLKYVVLPIVFKNEYVKNGKFDYSEFDAAVKASHDNHLTPIVVFSADDSNATNNYKHNSSNIISGYERLIKASIKRYHNQKIVWQMWNEPNSIFWFNQSADGNDKKLVGDWVSLGSKMQKWVREYNPSSVFLGGALAGNYYDSQNAIRLALNDGLAQHSDAIANHPYLSSNLSDKGAPENLLTYDSRSLLVSLSNKNNKKTVKNIPLVTTEFGYSMKSTTHGMWTEGDQANYIARSIFILDMMHQPIISLYTLVDEGNGDGEWGLYRGESPNYTPKQSGELVTQLLSNLNGFRFSTRMKQNSKRDYVLEYIRSGHPARYVCWTMDSNHEVKVAKQNVTLSQTPQIVYTHH